MKAALEVGKTVQIATSEYVRLLGDSLTLAALRAGGVDNWEGYGECFPDDDEEDEE